ncbi:hypothetical protein [Methylomicrobium sp. Wu6]|uniref:hypothetical protein n=1 Tax=Methylomicrobium sp. Wu6 TaxID=3107928 RepID=UPI002DD649D3|nr:hypothetical protein [Methylomicrobium sp. Wu6]MEC4749078.1 hypothetical protein [Methylomicrobium sp. Wu6]
MTNNIEQKSDEELWVAWGAYITAAGRIKKEIDRRQGETPFNRRGSPRVRQASRKLNDV